MAAPTGRAANPTNWVAKADSVPARMDSPGKNTAGKTRAAAVPYRKKSYHSIVVPTVLATAARMRWERFSRAVSRSCTRAAAGSSDMGSRVVMEAPLAGAPPGLGGANMCASSHCGDRYPSCAAEHSETDDGVRRVRLLEAGDLLVGELHVDGGDGVVQVVLLGDADDRRG